jgi:hypothetical protein
MPMQANKRELVKSPGDQNLWIYAGWLDIANVADDWETLLTLTKLYALFYERIIVFDGYFHCHGPLYDALKAASNDNLSIRSGLREDSLQKHEILKLLFEGIVVPAHREGSSMCETFSSASRGIEPGRFLCVDRSSGRRILRMVDEVAKFFYIQPEKTLGPHTSRFHAALWESLSVSETFIGHMLANPREFEENGMLRRDLAFRVRKVLDSFSEQLDDAKGNTNFRRGWVEQWAAKELDVPLRSYASFSNLVDAGSPEVSPVEFVVLTILNGVSTAYELMHCDAYGCQAGLFTSHHRDIPENRILRLASTATDGEGPSIPRVYKAEELRGEISRFGLSAQDVVEFRLSDLFKRYCETVKALNRPARGESLLKANPAFESFLFGEYADAIATLLRTGSSKSPIPTGILSAFGYAGSSLVTYASSQHFEGMEILGIPVSTMLRGAGVVTDAAGFLATRDILAELYVRHNISRAAHRFKINNYHLFSS